MDRAKRDVGRAYLAAPREEGPEQKHVSRVDGVPEGAHGDLPRPASE